ncbi:Acetolactate synthase-like protein [Schistosoma japonicum]|uniref:2-hydroxyacyl-CoA lyase 2 n=1 Tax=Schistosoma japonicum TaxID=6182 RepID=A0A4Z2DFG3_SCHJA|nr:Acetolactate synthase-like protein [Schistosoma japonicum]
MSVLATGSLLVFGLFFVFRGLRKYFRLELDKNSEHYGGELVANVLKAHNVPFIFTLTGGHISPILTASEKENIRVIDVRHEASAVFAADAVSRLSGSVGVAVVTAGPGLTNTVTAVKNAQMAESPVVLLAGAASGLLRGRGSLQDIDQLAVFRPICKWCKRVDYVRDIIPVLCEAFYVAQSDTPGPVLVELPIDVLYPYKLVEQHTKLSDKANSLRQKIVNWYLRFYLFNLFANGFTSKSHSSKTDGLGGIIVRSPKIPLPPKRQVEKLAQLVKLAEKSVLLIGSQAVLPPVSAKETATNIENLGIPTYMSGMARGLLGRDHRLGFRHARRTALREADLIILAGAICDFRLDYGRVLNRKAKIIVINRNKKNLYLNADYFWRPYLVIQADVGTTLRDLSLQLRSSANGLNCSSEWLDTLKSREIKHDEEIKLSCQSEGFEHNNPLSVLWKLEYHGLPPTDSSEDSIIVADGGDFVGSAAYIVRPRQPLSWLDPGPFGTLGVGGGFALGAKLCRPNATVWVVYGDGSAGYSLAEWDSLARHCAPAIAIIGNDACWSQIARDQVAFFQSKVGCQLSFTPYEVIGSAYSRSVAHVSDQLTTYNSTPVNGFLVDKAQLDQIVHIFDEVKRLSVRGVPSVINCLISASNFRDGSLSV